MSSKSLSLSLAAALVFSAVGVARAETNPAAGSRSQVRSAIDAGIYASESGVPDSVDNAKRTPSMHSPTNEEINAAETNNPESPDYKDRTPSMHSPTNEEINAAETNSPDSPDFKDRVAFPAS